MPTDPASTARFTAPPTPAKSRGRGGRWPDGSRRGLVPLLMDAVLSEADTRACIDVLFAEAATRGIPHARFEGLVAATTFKAPLLDPDWPTDELR